ncbi:L-threonylcarbamoyladenylate synthase [uncultured Parasutterella sp.]|jgi:Sua5/YciO/YrdC/YwlC family protein|uniref:L-threonylcarbamoyladenylate synthase n=1 Tax=uncultured Parasutterella sp. TaxID=1263098 RepID=UPI0025971303|nr:L-threonylcarbamoyladenylate synthase [uncultured Parasutterella sp.]
MGYILQVMPDSPQPHRINQAAELLSRGRVAAVPTDTGFSLVCRLDDKEALDKIRKIRQLGEKKHFTLLCESLSQMSHLARVNNTGYRMAKSVTPGPYTFILEATREVPRRLAHPSKKTIGLRVPSNKVLHSLLEKIGEPLIGTTVIMPGEEEALSSAWEIQDRIGDQLAFVLDDGSSAIGDTTVVDLSGDAPEIVREGLGSVKALGL